MLVNKKTLFNIVLTVGLALIILSSCIILGARSIIKAKLDHRFNEQLILIKELKQKQLQIVFADLKKQIEILKEQEIIKKAFKEFKILDQEFSDTNPKNNYQDYFERIIKVNNYIDLLLIDLSGNVIYNVKKDCNFHASLLSNDFIETEIANVFNMVRYNRDSSKSVIISNFSFCNFYDKEPLLFLATKVSDLGILIATVGFSEFASIFDLPSKIDGFKLHLIDQELHSVDQNSLNLIINSKDLVPIDGTEFSFFIETSKTIVLQDFWKILKSMLFIAIVVIPITLILIYIICFFYLEKTGTKINKISDFVQVVIAKKDLNSRIEIKDSSNNIGDLINNMLSWFQNILEKAAFKIRKFVDQYNTLLNQIAGISNNFNKEQQLITEIKNTITQLIKDHNKLEKEQIKCQEIFNDYQRSYVTFNNLHLNNNKQEKNLYLLNSIEYIFNICNLADLLSLQISMEARKKNKRVNNFLLLAREVKKMTVDLKQNLIKIKSHLNNCGSEHHSSNNFSGDLTTIIKPININIEKLIDLQKYLANINDGQLNKIHQLQTNLIDLEKNYSNINEQILGIVASNVKLNPEAQLDDYYPMKIVESE